MSPVKFGRNAEMFKMEWGGARGAGADERPVEDLSSRNVKKNINLNARHLYRRTKARITKNWCPKIVSRLPDSWIRRVPLHVIDTPITYVEGPLFAKSFFAYFVGFKFCIIHQVHRQRRFININLFTHAPAPHRAAKTQRNSTLLHVTMLTTTT